MHQNAAPMEESVKSSYWLLALSFLFIGSGPASAQNNPAMPIRTVSQALDSWITITENEVVGAADAMPMPSVRAKEFS